MRAASIFRHVRPYSIAQSRTTTIAHAFASAIAPSDEINIEHVETALRVLGQDPSNDLKCVYCDGSAQTWDHLEALVRNSQTSGHGHTLGNLVPACRDCNSARGNRDWRTWLLDKSGGEERIRAIEAYVQHCDPRVCSTADLRQLAPDAFDRYAELQQRVIDLLREADLVAQEIRRRVASVASAQSSG